ncbi:MAG: flagellar brake protein [Clostridiaceae bacterium]|jgi:c-di-GMP-binding flagellar brake protein YcgR|nr:flagellar brake protein [Clostridiaceae bacterium]
MKYHQIGLGTKIELELYDKNGNKINKSTLVSQYESYDEENNLMEIHVPFSKAYMYPIPVKAQIGVIFSSEKETYMFFAEVVSKKYSRPIPMLWIKPISAIEKIQRREFFRMECMLAVSYCVLDSLDNISCEKKPDEVYTKCYTRDISGGGIRILTKQEHESGTIIKAFIELEKEQEQDICMIGTIVRSVLVIEQGSYMYDTAVMINQIEDKAREIIIRYVFETQRERLKNRINLDEELISE